MTDPAPVRICNICDQQDDHPRHVFDLGGGRESLRHLDCCAAQGCDLCARQRRGAEDLRGDDLRAHLTGQTPTTTHRTVVLEG